MLKIFFVLFLFGIANSPLILNLNFHLKDESKKKLFEIIPDRIDVLFEDQEIVETRLRVKKVNKTRMISGYMNIKVPFGNDCKAECKILKKQGLLAIKFKEKTKIW